MAPPAPGVRPSLLLSVRYSAPHRQWVLSCTMWGLDGGRYGSRWHHDEPLTDPDDPASLRQATELAMIAVLRRQEALVRS